jgi:hypothetical protein
MGMSLGLHLGFCLVPYKDGGGSEMRVSEYELLHGTYIVLWELPASKFISSHYSVTCSLLLITINIALAPFHAYAKSYPGLLQPFDMEW